MDTPKQSRVNDLKEEKAAAQNRWANVDSLINPREFSPTAENLHPSATHEPVMPAEVYYNKMALDDDYDMPDGPDMLE